MKYRGKVIVLTALLLGLFSACGQKTPTLTLEIAGENIAVPGQTEVLTKYRFMGDVNYTQEICYAESLEPVELDLAEAGNSAVLNFSCSYSELTVQKENPDWSGDVFENVDAIELEPGCRYAITGLFRDGKYEYSMRFADIIVADTEETAAIKEQQTENWDYTAYLVYNGEKYRNTDGNTENLPEGYELLGATHEAEVWDAWDGEEMWATFVGEVYGKDGMLSLYATIPWEDRYIEFVPENIWSATEADYSGMTRGMYYFRDSTGQAGEYLWVFCGNGYDGKQQRIFDDYGETLQTGGVLPLSDEGQFDYINGYYDSEDALCLITLGWGDVVVYIYPPETEFWASRYEVAPEDCTKTVINGVTIYGDGAAEGEQKALILTLEDGTSCFIVGTDFAAPEPMAAIAEHFARNGVDLSAFSIEKGDYYQASSGLDAEASSYVSGCIPEDFNALGLESDVERKNGQINRVVFRVELGIGKHITWTVYPRQQDIEDTLSLGDITSLTPEMAQEAWGTKNGAAGFLCGDKYIWIKAGGRDDLADDIWELISQLI